MLDQPGGDGVVESGDAGCQVVDVVGKTLEHEHVMGTDTADEGRGEVVVLGSQPAPSETGEHFGVALAVDQRVEHRTARHAQGLGGNCCQFDVGVLESTRPLTNHLLGS